MSDERGHEAMSPDSEVGRGPCSAELIVREYGEQLRRFVERKFGFRHSDDIVARVWEKLAAGRLPDPDRAAMPWLKTVATRAGVDHLRQQPRHEELIIDLDASAPDRIPQVDDRMILDTVLAKLSAVERDAVVGIIDGYSSAEIGKAHGRTAHAMHCVATRARERLRIALNGALLPVFALLGFIRRLLRQVQPTTQVTMAVEIAAVVAVVLVAPLVFRPPMGTYPSMRAQTEQSSVGLAEPASSWSAAHRSKNTAGNVRRGPVGPGIEPFEPPAAQDPPVGIERDEGTAAPRYVGIHQPTIDTPYGPVGGGTIENECIAPRDFDTIPRNDHVYRVC